VAGATILLIMKSLKNRLVLLSALVAFPFSLFAGALQTVTLEAKNMTCAVCPITVKTALEKVPGVTSATVNFDKKQARVTFDDSLANVDKLREATANAGYPSALAETK
jgi:mercuric ion binding protein